MSQRRVQKAKMSGRIICILELMLITSAYYLMPIWVSQAAYLGMLMACVMCAIGKATNRQVMRNSIWDEAVSPKVRRRQIRRSIYNVVS